MLKRWTKKEYAEWTKKCGYSKEVMRERLKIVWRNPKPTSESKQPIIVAEYIPD